jgi:hypothetical protein
VYCFDGRDGFPHGLWERLSVIEGNEVLHWSTAVEIGHV